MLRFDEDFLTNLEARYTTPDAVAQREAVLAVVDPRPGEHGLDVGPGHGYLTCELANRIGPNGHLGVTDNSPVMLAATRSRVDRLGIPTPMDLRDGDATDLPFPAESFDFVVARQVFEYVPNVRQAVREMSRVLRPGGRAVIVDTDWSTTHWQVDDCKLGASVLQVWNQHLAHPELPRRLPGLLRSADLEVVAAQIIPVLNLEYRKDTHSFGLIRMIADFVRGRPELTTGDVDRWEADVRRQAEHGSYFFSLNQYLFLGRRPNSA